PCLLLLTYLHHAPLLLCSYTLLFFAATTTPEIYTFPYTTLFRSDAEDGVPVLGSVEEALPLGPTTALVGVVTQGGYFPPAWMELDRKSTRLNSSHLGMSYAVFCLKKKNICLRCLYFSCLLHRYCL